MTDKITSLIARELGARPGQVSAAVDLLDGGATVPFIARYRKEATGGLDDTQLRTLETRLAYLREMEDRRATILDQIQEQGKLTPDLRQQILAADTKTRLEDLYLPYKPKRRTKGEIAREAGLGPLAEALCNDPGRDPQARASAYVDAEKGFADTTAVLEGARAILAERFAEDAELVGRLREYVWSNGVLVSRVAPGKETEGAKFADYFEYAEALAKIPSHRALALLRGRKESILRLEMLSHPEAGELDPCEGAVAEHFGMADRGRPGDAWLQDVARHTWRVKIFTRIHTDLMLRLREAAETEAIDVFARNLKDLLLAAPAGARVVMGLDPGLRTGCKVAVVDTTGKLVDTATVYPHAPQRQWDAALATLAALCRKHGVQLVAIGNGTASRESERLIGELAAQIAGLQKIVVSEAGASVYSASELAAREFPDLDVSLRGAASIARRLQDPLAELVKIEPRAIGVGQYQHDVNQTRLARSLDAVVEDCVNAVGVDANTASAALLSRVSGLSAAVAEKIVEHRDANGAFTDRRALRKVERLGEKTFEQSAGFLRIRGREPLDASAVHPEAYPVVERIVAETGRPVDRLIGDRDFLRGLDPARFTDVRFGLPTVTDILAELEKPGRDPRPDFRTATFREGVEKISDLETGMRLEGVVTNVTNFGAFVDVGVHQDGLVHISAMAHRFVKDPHDVVKAGQVVKVKVLEVDIERKRIALTMKLDDAPTPEGRSRKPRETRGRGPRREKPRREQPESALAAALRASLEKG
ncbi:MAG: Tex family protein [Gammaproteobacteria bacterium]|jgi:uncharacterized protein